MFMSRRSSSSSSSTSAKANVLATSAAALFILSSLPSPTAAAPFYSPMIGATGAGPSFQAAFASPPTSAGSSGLSLASSSSDGTPVFPSFADQQADAMRQLQDVAFERCGSGDVREGVVTRARFGPCVGGTGEAGSPCELQAGKEYTLELTYSVSSAMGSPVAHPRAAIAADYTDDTPGAYPGQSFTGCEYTSCPISNDASAEQVFTVPLIGFPQALDRVTVNVTTSATDHSGVFCASVPVKFAPARAAAEKKRACRRARRSLPFAGMAPRPW